MFSNYRGIDQILYADGVRISEWWCNKRLLILSNYAEDQFTYLLQVWDELNRLATEDLVTVKKV